MYREVPLGRMLLALAVVIIPLIFLEQSSPRWAWGYVILILLGFVIVNYTGIVKASAFVSRELSKGG